MNTLKQAACGQTVKVVKLHGEGAVKRRIMDMGITKNTEIYVREINYNLSNRCRVFGPCIFYALRKIKAKCPEVILVLASNQRKPYEVLIIQGKPPSPNLEKVMKKYIFQPLFYSFFSASKSLICVRSSCSVSTASSSSFSSSLFFIKAIFFNAFTVLTIKNTLAAIIRKFIIACKNNPYRSVAVPN